MINKFTCPSRDMYADSVDALGSPDPIKFRIGEM